jgi:hypothetical protein
MRWQVGPLHWDSVTSRGIAAAEYPFPREKAPHSSGGIEVFRMHEKQEKCCICGNSELLARCSLYLKILATLRHLQGKIQGFTPLEQG